MSSSCPFSIPSAHRAARAWGAAVLCAQGALRAGAGLVTAACAQEVLPVLQAQAFCAMAAALPTRDGALAPEAGGQLETLMRGKQALCVGPGLSQRPGVLEAIRPALESDLPKVIDADALNLMASSGLRPGANTAVTPHPGEAARLLGVPVGEVTDDPAGAARSAACLQCCCRCWARSCCSRAARR